MINTYKINFNNFDTKLANTCSAWTSHDPERRGEHQARSEQAYLEECKDELFKYVKNETEQEFYTKTLDYFIDKYINKLNEMNGAKSRTASPMITGPANFKVTTKANESYSKRMQELCDLFPQTKVYFFKYLKKIRTREAGGELQEKRNQLEELEKRQELYKNLNKICTKKSTSIEEKLKASEEAGAGEKVLNQLRIELEENNGIYKPFASYTLTNNNAKIKARKQYIARQEKIEEVKNEDGATKKIADYKGGEIIQDLESQRINIIFDGKPEPETIKNLKSHGFRWSPKFSQWTRKLTNNALYSTKRLIQSEGI